MSLAGEAACGFDAVNVTVTKLRFHASATATAGDPGWTEITLQPARRINVAQLNNGALQALASAALVPGHYAQTRLVLDPNNNNDTTNSVIVAGTSTEVPLVTQTMAADGIALGAAFDIANGQSMTLIADLDACRSVVPNNGTQYLLRPVVKPLPTVKNGIKGFVATSMLGSHVIVTAQQNGVIVRATAPDPSGEFSLSRLEPGAYDVVVTADGRAAAVIAAVPVTSAVSTTSLNTGASAIGMPVSATGHVFAKLALKPASAVEPAYGAASQSFASGTNVVIGYRLADLATGFVTFTKLPMLPPQLAVYSASGALAFSPQPGVLPGAATYKVSASAPGYTILVESTLAVDPD